MLDLTFHPEGEATRATLTPAQPVRFYESSVAGHVSVVMPGAPVIGTRLNRGQVRELVEGLEAWLRRAYFEEG